MHACMHWRHWNEENRRGAMVTEVRKEGRKDPGDVRGRPRVRASCSRTLLMGTGVEREEGRKRAGESWTRMERIDLDYSLHKMK